MLEISTIREKKDEVIARLKKRNGDFAPAIEQILQIDAERRKTQNELDAQLAELNKISKEVGALMQAGKKDEANAAKEKTGELKNSTKLLQDQLAELVHRSQYSQQHRSRRKNTRRKFGSFSSR
jgi:seryl-tRNA synthetase